MKQIQKTTAWNMTEGDPAKLILRFAVPLLIGNLFQQFYSIVDSVIVGRFVGENEFGAIGCIGSIDYLIFSIGYGMSAGIGVLVAMMYGAGEKERLTKAIYNSAYLLLAVSLMITFVGVVGGPWILKAMKTPDNLYLHALLYLRMMCIGSTGSLFYGGISSIMRSFGDSRTPLIILLVSCVLNICLDLVFVLVFRMGVFGVAFATMIATLLSGIVSYLCAIRSLPLLRYQKGAFRIDRALIHRTIKLGIPLAGQNMLIAMSCMALQYVVNGFGDVMVTANTAVSKIDQLVQQPYSSLATALSAYTGQNIGARRGDRVRQGLGVGIKFVVVFTAVMVILFQFWGKYFLGIFVEDPQIIEAGTIGLRITSAFYLFLGLLYVVRGVLNGAGDALYSGINGMIELVCRFGMAAPLTMIPFIGKWGIFVCSGMTWMLTALISLVRYHTGSWKKSLNMKV